MKNKYIQTNVDRKKIMENFYRGKQGNFIFISIYLVHETIYDNSPEQKSNTKYKFLYCHCYLTDSFYVEFENIFISVTNFYTIIILHFFLSSRHKSYV